jgi:hypothetical protein
MRSYRVAMKIRYLRNPPYLFLIAGQETQAPVAESSVVLPPASEGDFSNDKFPADYPRQLAQRRCEVVERHRVRDSNREWRASPSLNDAATIFAATAVS